MGQKDSAALLGTESIGRLLLKYSAPAIVGQIAASLYNIVDSVFIGQGVGEMAISGLAITFPLMNMAVAFGAMVGVGGSTLISIKMGQKDTNGAIKVLCNVTILNLILGSLLTLLGLYFLDEILYFFGASENTIPYARDYMQIILAGNVFTHLYFGLNSAMRSSGHPNKAMCITLMTVVINAVLDPIFIFSFGWGIKGAATATVLAQFLAFLVVLFHFFDKSGVLRYRRAFMRLERNIVTGIFSIGVAPFVMNFCACFTTMLINNTLESHGGDLAIGAYGINNRIVMFFVMLVLGFNQGMQPIAGFNYGAKQFDRVIKVMKLTVVCATAVTTTAFLVGEFAPELIVRCFTDNAELTALSVNGMRIMVLAFPIVGFQMVVANFFQSIGQAQKSVLLSSMRQLLMLIPLLLILPDYFGLDGVWWSMPVSDFLSTVVAAVLLAYQFKSFKKGEMK